MGGIAIVLLWTPAEPVKHADQPRRLADVWRHPRLRRLDLGTVLHTVQMAMWVVVPGRAGGRRLPKAVHWHVYLPAVAASFVLMASCSRPSGAATCWPCGAAPSCCCCW